MSDKVNLLGFAARKHLHAYGDLLHTGYYLVVFL